MSMPFRHQGLRDAMPILALSMAGCMMETCKSARLPVPLQLAHVEITRVGLAHWAERAS
jgi:hypothetical protein